MIMIMRYLLCSLMIIIISACTPVKLPIQNTYVINAAPLQVKTNGRSHGIILIAMPDTVPVYNTTQIAYSKYPYQVGYFSQNQWAATPSQMLLPLLVETLRRTHAYKAVVTVPFLGTYQYLLNTQILDLRQTFTHHQARVKVSIMATLSGSMGMNIIASKRFDIVLKMRCITPYDGVVAMNQAVEIVLAKMANFCVQHRG